MVCWCQLTHRNPTNLHARPIEVQPDHIPLRQQALESIQKSVGISSASLTARWGKNWEDDLGEWCDFVEEPLNEALERYGRIVYDFFGPETNAVMELLYTLGAHYIFHAINSPLRPRLGDLYDKLHGFQQLVRGAQLRTTPSAQRLMEVYFIFHICD